MQELGGGVWGGVVAPLGSAYVAFLAMLALYRRVGRRERPRRGPRPPWSAILWHLVATALGGYLVFLAIVLVFSYMFVGQEQALAEALTGGASLAGVALLALALVGRIEGRLRRRPDEPSD